MLKRLRLKLICINMVLLMGMLCAILGLVVHFTQAGMEAESIRMMQTAVVPNRPRPWGEQPEDFPLPYLIVRTGQDGKYSAVWGPGYSELSEDTLRTLVSHTLEQDGLTGVLTDWELRFLKVDGPDKCLVFSHIYQERAALAQLTRTCMLAAFAGFWPMLLISFFLARWAVRPVERAWKQQKQFVADASHELKTPLTVILTDGELLQAPGCDEETRRRFAGHILIMARQMRGLTESLLELARADSGSGEQLREEVGLSYLISDALLPFEAVFFERGLTLVERIESGITVKGDPRRLKQVVDILLDNARKYASTGGTVTVTLRKKNRSRCLLEVTSPGEDIPRDELDNIFKRFYRLDRARSRDGSFGLGLSIAQAAVLEHRGRIWAESGGGINRFFIEFPAETK